jgi:hypothetical protein
MNKLTTSTITAVSYKLHPIEEIAAFRQTLRKLYWHRHYARNALQYGYMGTWSRNMAKCKQAIAQLRHEAISYHWRLWLTGKTNVRPTVDMPLTSMLEVDIAAVMAHYRKAWHAEAKFTVRAALADVQK